MIACHNRVFVHTICFVVAATPAFRLRFTVFLFFFFSFFYLKYIENCVKVRCEHISRFFARALFSRTQTAHRTRPIRIIHCTFCYIYSYLYIECLGPCTSIMYWSVCSAENRLRHILQNNRLQHHGDWWNMHHYYLRHRTGLILFLAMHIINVYSTWAIIERYYDLLWIMNMCMHPKYKGWQFYDSVVATFVYSWTFWGKSKTRLVSIR